MNAALHRRHGGRKMRVIGRIDHHGINFLVHFVKHSPEIFEEWLIRAPIFHIFRTSTLVNITKSDQIFFGTSLFIRLTRDPSARTDESDIDLAVG
jgi:hypothetical protein